VLFVRGKFENRRFSFCSQTERYVKYTQGGCYNFFEPFFLETFLTAFFGFFTLDFFEIFFVGFSVTLAFVAFFIVFAGDFFVPDFEILFTAFIAGCFEGGFFGFVVLSLREVLTLAFFAGVETLSSSIPTFLLCLCK